MDEEFKKQLQNNARYFQRALDRIAEKYSRLQQLEDDAMEVDLDNTHIETLEHYMTLSKKNVNKLSKSFAGIKQEAQPLKSRTRNSQLDYTCKEISGHFETTCSSEEDDANIETTSHTISPLDESQGNNTVISDQLEDQDEQLEVSLSSQGTSLGELYPDKISQIGKVWRRQHVSEAADSVRRRYRRWRKSNRTQMTNSFHAPQRPSNAKVTNKREDFNIHQHNLKSPVKTLASAVIKAGSPSPAKLVTNSYFSPTRRGEAPATAVVMDMSALSELHARELNKTFTMYEPPLNYSMYTTSSSRSSYPSNGLSQQHSFKMKDHYMTLSEKNVNKLSKSFAGIKEEAQPLKSCTRSSQLDYTCKEISGHFETTCSSEEDDANIETTSHTIRPLDESQGNNTVISDQLEDHDEQQEVSLWSQGTSLGALYPDRISQIGKVWQRQHVSEAADSVRRRYRRWRKLNRTQMTNSFHAPQTPSNAKVTSKGEDFNIHQHNLKSPVKTLTSAVIKAGSPSPAKLVTNSYFSPTRRGPATAVVMDISALSELHARELNKTFTVYEPPLNYSMYTTSSSRSSYPSNGLSQLRSFRMKESCMSPRHMQTAGFSGHAAENAPFKETYSSPVRQSPYKSRSASRNSFTEITDIYGSPVRKSPFKLHSSRESPQHSPSAHLASPKSPYMKPSISREAIGLKSASNFAPSMSPKTAVPRRTLEYSDVRLSPHLGSPQMSKPQRQHHGLRHEPYTTEDLDNDYIQFYHKYVCMYKSSDIQCRPCRLCAKDSEATRGNSLSTLAALALSPDRPHLRKRHRDLDINPQSKRFKEGHFTKDM